MTYPRALRLRRTFGHGLRCGHPWGGRSGARSGSSGGLVTNRWPNVTRQPRISNKGIKLVHRILDRVSSGSPTSTIMVPPSMATTEKDRIFYF